MSEISSSSNSNNYSIHQLFNEINHITKKNTISNILIKDEETKDISPSFHHLSIQNTTSFNDEIRLSPDSSPLIPRSPDSRWTPSPLCTPSPPLLHRCISSLKHEGTIFSIVVSKGLIFTGSSSTYVRAWQPLDCREKGYIQTPSPKIRAMLAHGGMLFTSHKDNKIRVWNIISHNLIFKPKKITTLPKINPFKYLISWTNPNNYNNNNNNNNNNFTLKHKDTISCMAYNHAEGILYTGSWDKTVKAWSLNHRKCIDSFAAHADNINSMVINQDGFIFTCSSDGTIKMWNRVSGENFHTLTMTLTFQYYPIYTLALTDSSHSESGLLYAGSSDGCINIYEKQNSGRYNHERCIQGHQFAVLCIETVGNLVISGSEDALIKIWRRSVELGKSNYECLAVLEGHKGPVKCLRACLEKENIVMGFLVFSASLDRTFKVWRVRIFPNEIVRSRNQSIDDGDNDGNVGGLSMSPALSPSWVENKLRFSGGTEFN